MAELAFALTFQPELVIVAAIPALDIPFISIAAILRSVLELVGQGHPRDVAAMLPDELFFPFPEEQLRIENRGSGMLWSRKRCRRRGRNGRGLGLRHAWPGMTGRGVGRLLRLMGCVRNLSLTLWHPVSRMRVRPVGRTRERV